MKRFFWGGGRAGRRIYFTIFSLMVIGSWVAHSAGALSVTQAGLPVTLIGPALLLVEAVSGWVLICITTQRLHDLGRSGWWQLLPISLACAVWALADPAWAVAVGLSEAAAGLAGIAAGLIYLGFLVAIGLPRSSTESNRFGAPPTASA